MAEAEAVVEVMPFPKNLMFAVANSSASELLELIHAEATPDARPPKLTPIKADDRIFVTEIPPETAIALLCCSVPSKEDGSDRLNRKVSEGRLKAYAKAMSSGRWLTSVLRLDKEGRVLDGQHRLFAVALSGKPQEFVVIQHVDVDNKATRARVLESVDAGLPRKPWDFLGEHGRERYQAALILRSIEQARDEASLMQVNKVANRIPVAEVISAVRGAGGKLAEAVALAKVFAASHKRAHRIAFAAGLARVMLDGKERAVAAFVRDLKRYVSGDPEFREKDLFASLGNHLELLRESEMPARSRAVSAVAMVSLAFLMHVDGVASGSWPSDIDASLSWTIGSDNWPSIQ